MKKRKNEEHSHLPKLITAMFLKTQNFSAFESYNLDSSNRIKSLAKFCLKPILS